MDYVADDYAAINARLKEIEKERAPQQKSESGSGGGLQPFRDQLLSFLQSVHWDFLLDLGKVVKLAPDTNETHDSYIKRLVYMRGKEILTALSSNFPSGFIFQSPGHMHPIPNFHP